MRRIILPLAIVVTIIFAGLFLLSSSASTKTTPRCKGSFDGSCCKKKSGSADKEIILENLSRQFISISLP